MGTGLDVSAMPLDALIGREWLAANGLGGYACSTVPCLNSRKYHGLLVAAMAPPVRRMVLLSRVEETLYHNGWPFPLATNEYPGTVHPEGYRFLRAFSSDPFPRWAYQGEGWTLEKSLHLVRGQNTVILAYTLLGGDRPVELELRPLLALRGIHELTYQWQAPLTTEVVSRPGKRGNGHCLRIPATSRTPEAFFAHDGAFDAQPAWYFNTIYRREQERGYPGLEDLWMPGVVRFTVSPGQTVHFACATDPIETGIAFGDGARAIETLAAAAAPEADATVAALARAADQFITTVPPAAPGPEATAQPPSVVVATHYPWAAPSIRLGLIAFPGLFLATGRHAEGRALLASLAPLLDGGLLPSELPEDGAPPLYHGADVSLWFVYAVHQYLRYTGDEAFVREHLFHPLAMAIDYYRNGTRLGIAADADGLVSTRQDGVGTTWMDAQTGDSVMTPRAGIPVELNALWYNAVCVMAELSDRFGEPGWAAELTDLARSIKDAFNRRFWNEATGCCYDVIGTGVEQHPDVSVRPNQLLAASLPFPVLDLPRHERVLEKVKAELLTPVGVRTLSPSDPNYQGRYDGNVASRDRAHHNGSAFPWLLGPLVTTHARVRGRGAAARNEALAMIRGCLDHMNGDGLGQLCELFDGNAPHAPGGALAAAAAVGELLRCYVEDVAPEGAGEAAPGPLALELSVAPEQPPRVPHPA